MVVKLEVKVICGYIVAVNLIQMGGNMKKIIILLLIFICTGCSNNKVINTDEEKVNFENGSNKLIETFVLKIEELENKVDYMSRNYNIHIQ